MPVKKYFIPLIFLLAAICLLWKPLIQNKAILPGDYLSHMQPWQETAIEKPQPQWNPLVWDAISQYYPWRVFLGRSISSGYLPLWNPHQFCGNPFLANGQSAVFYLPNWIFALCDPRLAIMILALLHLTLSGYFTYLLAKDIGISGPSAVCCGLCYELCAFIVLWIELPTFICVATWLPCSLWLLHRTITRNSLVWAVGAAIALALSVLAGHLQIAFYVWTASVLWTLYCLIAAVRSQKYDTGRAARAVFTAFALGAVLSACQIIPSLELGHYSHRQVNTSWNDYNRFVGNGVPSHRLITAVAPDYFGNPNAGNYLFLGDAGGRYNIPADYMEFGLYIGILPLLAAIIGITSIRKRYVVFWVTLGALSLACAFGSGLNIPFYFGVPGFSALGGPNRILILYMISTAILCGYGLDRIKELAEHKISLFGGSLKSGAAYALAACVIVGLFMVIFGSSADKIASELPKQLKDGLASVQAAALLRFAMFMLTSGAVLFIGGMGILRGKAFGIIAGILIVLDLAGWGSNTLFICNRNQVYPDTQITDYLKNQGFRRVSPDNRNWSMTQIPDVILPPNSVMVYGYYDVQGYDSLYTRLYKDYLTTQYEGRDPSPPENGNMILGKSTSIHGLEMRIGRLTSPPPGSVIKTFGPLVLTDGGNSTAGAVAGYMTYDYSNLVELLPVITDGPNRISIGPLKADSRPILLRITGYPGWMVDGGDENGTSIESDGIWMKIVGNHNKKISMRFEPVSVKLGLFLSLLGLSICTAILTHSRLEARCEAS